MTQSDTNNKDGRLRGIPSASNLASIKREERKMFDPKNILQAPRRILYKEKRKLKPGEYIVEISTYKE